MSYRELGDEAHELVASFNPSIKQVSKRLIGAAKLGEPNYELLMEVVDSLRGMEGDLFDLANEGMHAEQLSARCAVFCDTGELCEALLAASKDLGFSSSLRLSLTRAAHYLLVMHGVLMGALLERLEWGDLDLNWVEGEE
ncbi:MAG: hypothetical protein ACRC2U_19520 [Aeromonas sp.]